jgi:hypothetical protein
MKIGDFADKEFSVIREHQEGGAVTHGINVVVDEDGGPIGVFGEGDYVGNKPFLVVDITTPLQDVATSKLKSFVNIGAEYVITIEHGKVKGVTTIGDIQRYVAFDQELPGEIVTGKGVVPCRTCGHPNIIGGEIDPDNPGNCQNTAPGVHPLVP